MKRLPKLAPQRHAHGPLISQNEQNPRTKARVRRWAKRVVKRRQAANDGE